MIDPFDIKDLSDEEIETLIPDVDDEILKTINLDYFLCFVECVGDTLIKVHRGMTMNETKRLTDYEKIYRGCAIGIIENVASNLVFLADDLELCPGEVSEEELSRIREMVDYLNAIEDRLNQEIQPYLRGDE